MSSTDRPDNETTSSAADQRLLNTYIYDYLVKQSYSATALAFKKEVDIPTISEEEARKRRASDDNPEGSLEKNLDASSQQKEAASRINGTDDVDIASNSDTSSKNAPADVPIDLEGGFLVEWWTVFWDMFAARQGRPSSSNAASFIAHSQRLKAERQNGASAMGPQSGGSASQLAGTQQSQFPQARQAMPNGHTGQPEMMMAPANELVLNPAAQMNAKTREALMRQAMMNNGQRKSTYPPTPAEIQRLKTQQYLQQQQQVGREEMEGQHPSPSAPSPSKRQRLSPDGAYAATPGGARPAQQAPGGTPANQAQQAQQAQQMLMQAGINPAGLSPQQLMAFQSQTPGMQQKQLSAYVQGLASQQQRAMQQAANGPGSQAQMMAASGADGSSDGPPQEGNHALQDYQMQLMLLEQQNKKRLLMARQEQERLQQPGEAQQGIPFNTSSPQGRLPGSPPTSVPPEQRGTPKMANQHGPGSPSDGPQHPMQGQMQSQVPRNASPAMNFQPGIGPPGAQDTQRQMIYQRMMQQQQQQQENGAIPLMMGPQGQIMGRGMPQFPPGHPAYNNPQMMQQMMQNQDPRARMFQQQMMQQQMQQNGQIPRGMTPQQQHQQAMAQQHAAQAAAHHQQQMQHAQQQQLQQQQGQQHPAQMAPHQQMPPPQTPAQQQMNRAQPPSPSLSNNQPPTPQQQHAKPPPRKAAPEKARKAATKNKKNGQAATPTASEPPTPTTPATPLHTQYGAKVPGQPHPAGNQLHQAGPGDSLNSSFSAIEGGETSAGFSMGDFAGVTGDIDLTMMQDFDFDSFLQDDSGSNTGMNFAAFTDH